jgi:hypothetical protein
LTEPLKFHPEWRIAAGEKVLAGRTGILFDNIGIIKVNAVTNLRGVDANLWRTLKAATDALKIQIYLSSIDTGKHNHQSRHYQGRAVDIAMIGKPGGPWEPVNVKNPLAVRLADWLLDNGFGPGEKRSHLSIPGLIFGPPQCRWNVGVEGHLTHIHASVVVRKLKS